LAIIQGLSVTTPPGAVTNPQREALNDLIGTITSNIFTVCQDTTPVPEFNALLDITNDAQETIMENAFNTVLLIHKQSEDRLYQCKSLHSLQILKSNQKYQLLQ
jgi:hypothetical protein